MGFPVVVVPKQNNNIRLCVDMRVANTAIKRTRHPIPTLESVSMELNGASFFSKLDLCQAYHQLELSPEFRHITTFCTHLGLFRYKRLNYGTNAAAELFQHTLQQTLQGIKGIKNIDTRLATRQLKTRSIHEAPRQSNKNCSSRKSQLGPRNFQVLIELSNHTTFLNEHPTCSIPI